MLMFAGADSMVGALKVTSDSPEAQSGREEAPARRFPRGLSYPGYYVMRIAEYAGATFADRIRHLGVDERGLRVLAILRAEGPMSQTALVSLAAIDRTTLVRVIDDLEEHGYAVRQRNPRDRRSFTIVLTPEGERCSEAALAIGNEINDDVFSPLSESERELCSDMLRRMADALPPAPNG
jgi:DNA-binding MarR family transcriptional regulator